MNCPKCNSECDRDEVDIDVAVQCGPYGCPSCGWSEWPEYDCSEGASPKQQANPEWYVDQWGGMQRISAIAASAERFGIPREVTEQVFAVAVRGANNES